MLLAQLFFAVSKIIYFQTNSFVTETSKKVTNKEITPNCWYAEVGLWDGRSSPHDSSLSEQGMYICSLSCR